MVTHDDIKASLPNWPDDVIDQGLLKLANRGSDTGWPPPKNLQGSAWENILGRRPLSWWERIDWHLEERGVNFNALCAGTRRIVNALIDGHLNDTPNIYSVGDNSKTRFFDALGSIAKNGIFSYPIITVRLDDGLSVLDGNHRVAALCACQAYPEIIRDKGGHPPAEKQPIWVGTHTAGEVPLD
jgi:hypothetical protein